MITCARCSKTNQDHYKFCLGCGAKLEAPAPGPGLETARTAPQPEASPTRVAPVAAAAATVMAPPTAAAMAPTPPPRAVTPPPRAVTPSPRAVTPSPLMMAATHFVAAAAPAVATPSNAAAGPQTVDCPACGKPVVVGYTFCGGCGHRMKPAAAPADGAAAPQRTMFMASPNVKAAPHGHLTLIRPDGTEGGAHALQEGENLIGRGQGSLFDADPYLSPRHAEFTLSETGLVVQDLRSLNGVFVKLTGDEKLESGDVFRIGQELLRFDVITAATPLEDGTEVVGTPNPGYWGRISVVVGRESDGPAFPLFDESVVLGRERGDILFPEDGYVSGAHAQVTLRDGQVYLSDLGSSNGTFFHLRGPRALPAGSLVLMGQQLFRASYN